VSIVYGDAVGAADGGCRGAAGLNLKRELRDRHRMHGKDGNAAGRADSCTGGGEAGVDKSISRQSDSERTGGPKSGRSGASGRHAHMFESEKIIVDSTVEADIAVEEGGLNEFRFRGAERSVPIVEEDVI
jgi:hypothetical protein